jgi:DNA repair protein RecN (Recombination protein N)
VGGAIAEVIGRKLEEVAAHHQVIVITHLPQIAVFAKTHFNVRKAVEAGRTRSLIERLTATEREQEVARMLGGVKITEKTKAAAREMLRSAER